MRRGVPQGYTIVEVMIFLAVTGALFAMIALTFAGQRGRAQFQASAREIESRMRDLVNDTSTGFFQTRGDFSCTATATGPSFTGPNVEQGSHQGCIFLGPAVQFGVGGDGNRYDVFTVAGLRRDATEDKEVENFDETNPRAVTAITDQLNLPNGASVASIYYNNGGPNVQISAIGLLTSFGRYDEGALQPGSLSVNVIPLPVSGSSCAAGNVACQIGELGSVADSSIVRNPSNGITLCINSGTSDQHAILRIGGSNRQLTTDLTIAGQQIAAGGTC